MHRTAGTRTAVARSVAPCRLLVWSASDDEGEEAQRRSLHRWLRVRGDAGFAGVADAWRQAAPGRVHSALVAAGTEEALAALEGLRPGAFRDRPAGIGLPVAMLLPGQGAQHPRMAVGLYRHRPVFTGAVDEVLGCLGADGDAVRGDWLTESPVLPIDHVARAVPLIFAVDYALGRLLLAWGVRPAVLLGQGVGELAAATLAGVLTVSDAVEVLREQVAWLRRAPRGGMLAIAAGAGQVLPHLPDGVSIAAVNGPAQTVVAGALRELADAARVLAAAGYDCRYVRAGAAYHSPVVAEACAYAARALRGVRLVPPAIPLLSPTTAAPLPLTDAVDPGFWARQPSSPVRLRAALDTLFAAGEHLCVETGPGQGLYALLRRHPAVSRGGSRVLSLLRARPRDALDDRRTVLQAAARMWTSGQLLDLEAVQRRA